mgnify:CR=1 FL=1
MLKFYPSSLEDIMIEDDIASKLLYGKPEDKDDKHAVSIKDIMNTVPGVQIREFLPDTRLD